MQDFVLVAFVFGLLLTFTCSDASTGILLFGALGSVLGALAIIRPNWMIYSSRTPQQAAGDRTSLRRYGFVILPASLILVAFQWSWGLLLVFAVAVIYISAAFRWFGAPLWVVVCIPAVPLALWFLYCLIWSARLDHRGGSVPLWPGAGVLLLVALGCSVITALFAPNKDRARRPPIL